MAFSHGFEYLFTIRSLIVSAVAHRAILCSDQEVMPCSFSADIPCGDAVLKSTIQLALKDMYCASSWDSVSCKFDDCTIPDPSVPPASYAYITLCVPVRSTLEDEDGMQIDLDLSEIQISVPVFVVGETVVARFSEVNADGSRFSVRFSPCEFIDYIGPAIVSSANIPERQFYYPYEDYYEDFWIEVSMDPDGQDIEIVECDPLENRMAFKQLIQIRFGFPDDLNMDLCDGHTTVVFEAFVRIPYELDGASVILKAEAIEIGRCEVTNTSWTDWEVALECLNAIPEIPFEITGDAVIAMMIGYFTDMVKEAMPEDIVVELPDLQAGFGEQLTSSFSGLPDAVLFKPDTDMTISSLSARLKPDFMWIGINGSESPLNSVRLYDDWMPFMVSVSSDAFKDKIDPEVDAARSDYNDSGDNEVEGHKVTIEELSIDLWPGKIILFYQCEVAVDCCPDPTVTGFVEFIHSGITLDGEFVFTVEYGVNDHRSYLEGIVETVSGIVDEAIRSSQLVKSDFELQDEHETVLSVSFLEVEITIQGITVWGGMVVDGPWCQNRPKNEMLVVSVGIGNMVRDWARADIIAVKLNEMDRIFPSEAVICLMEQGKLEIDNLEVVEGKGGRKTLQLLDKKGQVVPIHECPRFDYGGELERQVRRSMWRVARGGRWGQYRNDHDI